MDKHITRREDWMSTISCRIVPGLKDAVRAEAAVDGLDMGDYVLRAILAHGGEALRNRMSFFADRDRQSVQSDAKMEEEAS